ncbi:MAG: DUF1631 family protein [Gammaproteobacteria bacterium]|nr:DUF1631 family protein [Gammaproteobacteria bacterium]
MSSNLESLATSTSMNGRQQNQAFIQIQPQNTDTCPTFSLTTRVAYINRTGLGVAFLNSQKELLNYFHSFSGHYEDIEVLVRSANTAEPVDYDLCDSKMIQAIQNISQRFLSEELPHFFTQLDQELLEITADSTRSSDHDPLYYGLSGIAENQEAILEGFLSHIQSGLTLQSLNQKLFYERNNNQDLQLVNKEDFDEWVMIIGTTENLPVFNLLRLEKALTQLAGCFVNSENNPLSPYSLLWVLNDILDKLGTDFPVKKTVFRILKEAVLTSTNRLYEELVDYLEKQGVISGGAQQVSDQERHPESKNVHEEFQNTGDDQQPVYSQPPVRKINSFEALSALLVNDNPGSNLTEPDGLVSVDDIIRSLEAFPCNSNMPLVPRIEEHLANNDHRDEPRHMPLQIRNTISATEHLMDAVENDRTLSIDLRNLVRGLEVPLVRESITDPNILENDQHPVRLLFDSIERLAPYFAQGEPSTNNTSNAVQQLKKLFSDSSTNATQVDISELSGKINALIESQQSVFETNVAAVLHSTTQDDLLRRSRIRVQELLTKKLKGVSASGILSKLLKLGWPEILVLSSTLPDQEEKDWKAFVSVIDFLTIIFDLERKPRPIPSERIANFGRILDRGFSLYPLHPKEAEELTQTITSALIEGSEAYQSLLQDRVEIDDAYLQALFQDQLPLSLESDEVQLRDPEWINRVKSIEVEEWIVEQQTQGQVRLLHLAWKNPGSSRFVFVDGNGKRILDSQVAHLASQFEINKYSLLENRDLPLVERAVQKALKSTYEKIRREGDIDELTGLMNRKAFEREIMRVTHSTDEEESEHVLIMMDIDQFSMINDVCGFEGGDHLLQTSTSIISTYMNPDTLLARTGNDEFGVLMERCSLDRGFQLAEAMRRALETFKFDWNSMSVPVTVSIGMITINSNSGSPGKLLKDAFSACRIAKEAGRNCTRLFQSSGREFEQRQRMIRSVPLIEQALESNLIELYAQLISPLDSKDTSDHFEILIRVLDEKGIRQSPVDFIQAAEQFDRMRTIDRWVLSAFFTWLKNNHDKLSNVGGFTLNLSGQSLQDETFAWFIKEQISQCILPPRMIGFEVTETALVRDVSKTNRFIREIRNIGCRFYLDDFGSGYASYSHLKDMPVDSIKIDGVFVSDMLQQKSSHAMVKSITEIAHCMGKTVVAEFVENESILHALRKIGVDFAQGYQVGRPIPIDQILTHCSAVH